jgi:sterol 3beta-glucosyltransferase
VESGPAPIYIGLGSWTKGFLNPVEQQVFTRNLLSVLKATNNRAVILTGLLDKSQIEQSGFVFEAEFLPHQWLFPKCKAILHHGGAGTAILALKSQKPSIVVPVSPMQAPWGDITKEVHAGTSLTRKQFLTAKALQEAFNYVDDPHVVEFSQIVGNQVAEEAKQGVQRTIDAVMEQLIFLHERQKRFPQPNNNK